MGYHVENKPDDFKAGDKVVLGTGEKGVVARNVTSPTGFRSLIVEVKEGPREGTTVTATAPALRKQANRVGSGPVVYRRSVRLGHKHFDCVAARTPAEQRRGLQGWVRLASNEGMVFPFEPARDAVMHMATVDFPIDMVFVAGGKVAKVVTARPGGRSKWACRRVDAVVEVAAGSGVKEGAPAIMGPERYEISFPNEVHDIYPEPSERFKDRSLPPDGGNPNSDQMSPDRYQQTYGYDVVLYHDNPVEHAVRPSASRKAQVISDPAEFIVALIEGMKRADHLQFTQDALNPNLGYATVRDRDLATIIGELGLDGGPSTDMYDVAQSEEGMQILGDGLVLGGAAQIANLADHPEGGKILVLWREL